MNLKNLFLGTLAGSLLISSQAMAYMINDGYVGSDDQGYGDVIGSASNFDIHGIDLSLSGTSLTVDIFTNFAGKADNGLFSGYTASGNGIGYGDLFLASSWNPFGVAPYMHDDHSTGTLWEYGLALDDRWSASGGSATLYALSGATNNDNALLSEDFMTGATYRDGQEIAVDTNRQPDNVGSGTWSVEDNYIRMVFDISGASGLLDNGELALHWAMTCGNDTIEGSWDVPEPSALSLMGLSLLAIGMVSRRRKSA